MKSIPVAVTLAVLLILDGCSARSGARQPDPAGTSTEAVSTVDAELAYGSAPKGGSDITYQPDVVIVGGGPASIRSVSTDFLTWTIDAHAAHASDLAVGKVMFLTNRALGRVLKVNPQGDTLAVTLGPVDLGDVIRDGTLSVNQAVDPTVLKPLRYDGVGGLADVQMLTVSPSAAPSTPTTASGQDSGTTMALASFTRASRTDPGNAAGVSVGGFSMTIIDSALSTALKIGYKNDGVVFGGTFGVGYTAPKVDTRIEMRGGRLVNGSHLVVTGINRLTMSTESGSEQGLSRNIKARIEVPMDESIEIPTEPIPLVLGFRFKFIAETAFSAKNGNLTATGALAVNGPIGFSYNNGYLLHEPSITPVTAPVDTMSGVSVGVNAVVFAAQLRIALGVGIPAATVGPFAAITASYGMTLGSSLGIVQCRQTSLDVIVSGGIGLNIDAGEASWLKAILGPLSAYVPKVESELVNQSTSIVHTIAAKPPVSACT